MTIREAIHRTPAPPNLSDSTFEAVISDELTARRNRENAHKLELVAQGVAIFRESGVLDMLDELQGIINSGEGPRDATTSNIHESYPNDREYARKHGLSPKRFELGEGGIVSTGIGWNYNDGRGGSSPSPHHNALEVKAYPLTGALAVEGHLGSWLFPRSKWETPEGKIEVEDAIARAYKKPARWGRPVHIG